MERYNKLQKIGQGSFGCAYLATKKGDVTSRKYVIKEIRMDPRDQQTALREAKLLAALDHPNIITCRESFLSSPNVLCIVTEFADGGDLRKQLTERASRRSLYRESDLLELFVQICLALKHLHDRKIIHRDIKPENIFLTSSHVVKLGDFGVATVLSHTLACAQTLTGTPYYTSPEICLGKSYNSKTDVWSLGCVLYELLTFSHAFNGRSQRQLFENIINGVYPAIPSGYSSRIAALVSEMLQKNPRDRPSVNQIIKKPVVMERIQSFLSQRAIADELNHTVLHGQHIFKNNPLGNQQVSPVRKVVADRAQEVVRRAERVLQPRPAPTPCPAARSPAPRVRAVQYEPKRRPEARRNSLKSSSVKKKLIQKRVVASPTPAPAKTPSAAAMPLPPPPSRAAVPSPGQRRLSEMQQKLLQRKKEVVAKAREDANKRKAAASPAANRAPPVKHDKPKPVVGAHSKPKASSPGTGAPVADRISAFMAQWQAQRDQILNNIASPAASPAPQSAVVPPPAPVSAALAKKPSGSPTPPAAVAPPPAPLVAAGVVLKRGAAKKLPTSDAALAAAKQREAMRRDIQERKKAAMKGPSAKPLDDPVILVQNLPDFDFASTKTEPPAVASPAAAPAEAASPPPVMPPPAPIAATTEAEEVNEEEAEDEEDDDVPTPDSTVAEKANLEFQRMLLQLQSVVDDPNDAGEEDEEDEQVDAGAQQPNELDVTTLPPPAFFDSLSVRVLEERSFKEALRARLRGVEAPGSDITAGPHTEALVWLHRYIQAVISE